MDDKKKETIKKIVTKKQSIIYPQLMDLQDTISKEFGFDVILLRVTKKQVTFNLPYTEDKDEFRKRLSIMKDYGCFWEAKYKFWKINL
jgi:hypothetical protein